MMDNDRVDLLILKARLQRSEMVGKAIGSVLAKGWNAAVRATTKIAEAFGHRESSPAKVATTN